MKITTKSGDKVLIDIDDYRKFRKRKWFTRKDGRTKYVYTGQGDAREKSLHRLILGLSKDDKTLVDHINGNGLDNRKANLRTCTQAQNSQNSRRRKDNQSGYKGVHREKGKWIAKIKHNGITYRLGAFGNKKEAAKAYDKKATDLFGDFALVNNPQ